VGILKRGSKLSHIAENTYIVALKYQILSPYPFAMGVKLEVAQANAVASLGTAEN